MEENQKNTFFISEIFFFSKIAQITYCYAFILILRQYIYFFFKTAKMTPFLMFFGDLQLLKENHFFYEKKYDITPKVTFSSFYFYFHLLVEENQKNTFFISTIFFSQICTNYLFFLLLSLFYDNIFIFSLKPHK